MHYIYGKLVKFETGDACNTLINPLTLDLEGPTLSFQESPYEKPCNLPKNLATPSVSEKKIKVYYQVSIYDDNIIRDCLAMNILHGDFLLLETSRLYFDDEKGISEIPGFSLGNFIAPLGSDGFVVKISPCIPLTLHFIIGYFESFVKVPGRGKYLNLRETRRDLGITHSFKINRSCQKEIRDFTKGEKILVKAGNLFPVKNEDNLKTELYGEALDFFSLEYKVPRILRRKMSNLS
jgi:hypothetical protein